KTRLADDIQRLQAEKEYLQHGQHIGEQQALVRQLAQVLANHISSQLQSSLENLATQAVQRVPVKRDTLNPVDNHPRNITRNAEQLVGSLDDTLTIAFNTLQQELKNYQSNFSQQLLRMQSQQQQGEAILAELVNSLRAELETTRQTLPSASPYIKHASLEQSSSFEAPTNSEPDSSSEESLSFLNSVKQINPVNFFTARKTPRKQTQSPDINTSAPEKEPSRQTKEMSLGSLGLWLIVLSTAASSVYNVALKVIFHPNFYIFGVFEVERLISPTLGNSLLILMLRMMVVVPLMLLLAPILHPRIWQDVQNLIDSARNYNSTGNPNTKQVLVLSVLSGCFLFLSQVLLYLAIGQVPTGIAITLFFVYPVFSGLLSWFLFRDRLTSYSGGAVSAIGLGELLVLLGSTSSDMGNMSLGGTSAIFSGVAFGFYVVLTRICAAKIHPVTFTLMNFVTMLLLSFLSLIVPLPTNWSMQINPNKVLELILSAFILGLLTLCGYLLNSLGVRKIGANQAAIFGALVPALTVVFAGLIIQESFGLVQVLGVMLVTLGAAAFSIEKIRNRVRQSRNVS
ncbi:DMT family transporter, partial [Aetokthonos hydrillicola]|uniref:DMT family transporter n=1 Tax=Aetokthonos hydrillicola TaxID=1550245 RepID=UPI001ABB74E8